MGNFLSGRRTEGVSQGTAAQPLAMPLDLPSELAPYWARVTPQLPGGVTANDQQLVVQLCEALYVQGKAWQSIVSAGISSEDAAHGNEVRRNPAIITWRQAADMARQCMALLGLSPVSRARMQADADAGSTEFLKYLQRRHGQAD